MCSCDPHRVDETQTGVLMRTRHNKEYPALADRQTSGSVISITARLVRAYLGRNPMEAVQLPALIANVHGALMPAVEPARTGDGTARAKRPAVPVRSSIKPDHIVCLEDGRKVKMLKRYLRSRFGMTPEAYRAKWGLPPSYPMVAPSLTASRREQGRKRRKS